jgi:putative tryptophan/tyrosine transport system substrate-binding protein
MRRREFIAGLGGAAAWPLAAQAQQGERVRRVGAMIAGAGDDTNGRGMAAAFRRGLERLGWIEGRNIHIEFRYTAADPALFKVHAAELVGLRPDAILAGASTFVAALKPLTSTIPIVFVLTTDPVAQGFVQSLARPGGNITGFAANDAPLMTKWLSLLKDAAPNVSRIAVIFNPDTTPYAGLLNSAIIAAAPIFGMSTTLAPVRDDAEIERAVAAHGAQPGGALVILPEAFVTGHRHTIIAAARSYHLPTIGMNTLLPYAGGLMTYFPDILEVHAQAATYIDRILKGDAAADLPVQLPTKFVFILNLKTAKELGLTIPPGLIAITDEIIE